MTNPEKKSSDLRMPRVALLALVDRTTLDEMEDLRAQVEVIELNLADGFEARYIEHLMLP
jgi:uncharacterized 2Fe-2S/4Fe-4S cluster protein (DUF4445 family)